MGRNPFSNYVNSCMQTQHFYLAERERIIMSKVMRGINIHSVGDGGYTVYG